MRKRTQAREYALQMLYQYELNPEPLDKLFGNFWSQNPDPSDETRFFAEGLVKGTVDNLEKINEVVARYAENWDMNRMAVIDRSILRFATYELLFCHDIPLKVSINEAVNIAKKFSQEDSGKFVNGILDKISHSEKPPKQGAAESGLADSGT
jgi:transcription antitermination protein NusB